MRDTDAWALPLDIVERAVNLYMDNERRTLEGMPAARTDTQQDCWALLSFTMAVDAAVEEAVRAGARPQRKDTKPAVPPAQGRRPTELPVGMPDDPTSWTVSEGAQGLLREYIDMAQRYGFDETLNRVVCALDVQGMRSFVNSFTMDREDWTRGTEPCARAFTLVTDLMGMGADAAAFRWGPPGMGKPWWQDTSTDTTGSAGQQAADSMERPSTKRDSRWSRKTRGGEATSSSSMPSAVPPPVTLHPTGSMAAASSSAAQPAPPPPPPPPPEMSQRLRPGVLMVWRPSGT